MVTKSENYMDEDDLKADLIVQKRYNNYKEARIRLRKIAINSLLLWPISIVLIATNYYLDKQWLQYLITFFLLLIILCVSIPNIRLIRTTLKWSPESGPLRKSKHLSYIGLIATVYASISIWIPTLSYGIIGVIIGMICAWINGLQGEREPN